MKLLLTSGGVTNASIAGALVELLGKETDEATSALLLYPTTARTGRSCSAHATG